MRYEEEVLANTLYEVLTYLSSKEDDEGDWYKLQELKSNIKDVFQLEIE